MKKIALALVLLALLAGSAVLAQDSPPKTKPMQMYHIVLAEKGPNWKPQSDEGGMDARMQALENIKKAAESGLIVSAGLVNDETDVEFILIMDVETKGEAHTILYGAPLIKNGFFKPVIYSYFAPKGLKLIRD